MGYDCYWSLEMQECSNIEEYSKAISKVMTDAYGSKYGMYDYGGIKRMSADGDIFPGFVLGPDFYLRLAMAAPKASFISESSCSFSITCTPNSFEKVVFKNGVLEYTGFDSEYDQGIEGLGSLTMREWIETAADDMEITKDEMSFEEFIDHYNLSEDVLPQASYEKIIAGEDDEYAEKLFFIACPAEDSFFIVPEVFKYKISEDGRVFCGEDDITDSVMI